MLNLIFAPSANKLVPLAWDRMRLAWTDPFDPPVVIVPNPAVGKWLRTRLIEEPDFECAANVRVAALERFLWNALGGGDRKMLGAEQLSQVICALLDSELLKDDIYTPLRNYLYRPESDDYNVAADGRHEASSKHPRVIDTLKRVQLSTRVARQFLEYEYNRPSVWDDGAGVWRRAGIDAKWLAGENYFDGDGHEAWQKDLYRRAHKCFSNDELTTLPHLYRRRREECAKNKRPWCDVGTNTRLFLFGVSKISHFHRNTLVEISQTNGIEMHVFLTNPCAEFWEDVDTSRRSVIRRRWSHNSPDEEQGIKPFRPEDYNKPELDMFSETQDQRLLELWGKAGQENIRLWCPQAEWNFDYYCDDVFDNDNHRGNRVNGDDAGSASAITPARSGDTLLAAVQRSLLTRQNDLDISGVRLEDDVSIQILACPDIGREVEELREQLLDMALDGTIKSFNDAAVYIPDPNKYLPHIQRVFGARAHWHPEYIPFSILGASSGSCVTARGLTALFNIISRQFNRAQIFELMRNPVVQTSRKFKSRDVDRWEEWAEKFGMFRGYDAEQRKNMGDMGDAVTGEEVSDEHTFGRGIGKIFSELKASPASIAASVSTDNGLFDDMMSEEQTPASTDKILFDDMISAQKFSELLNDLNELSSSFIQSGDALDIRESIKNLRRAIWRWFGTIPDNGAVNGGSEARIRGEVLDGLDAILLQSDLAGRRIMGLDEFAALARGCVPDETPVVTSAWRGVTFAPLRASMVLPHSAIFVMGLGAADFPGTNEKCGWDLLSGKDKSIIGDSDRVLDNRFAFLELIHAAKKRLILSYRARDMQKDESLQPSSVILELEEYLISQGLTDGNRRCRVRHDVPWVVHESLAATARRRKHGTWDKAQRELALLSANERVKHRYDLVKGVKASNSNSAPQQTAELRDIKLFFKNPLEYHLSKTLEIRDDDNGNDITAIDGPIDSGYYLYRLRKKVWAAVLELMFSADVPDDELTRAAADGAAEIYDEHIESGQAPEGHIRRMEKEALIKWAESCAGAAAALRLDFPNHQFAEKHELSFECGRTVVRGVHELIIMPKTAGGASGVIAFANDGEPLRNPDLWLDGLARSIYNMKNGGGAVSLILLGYGDKPDVQISPMRFIPPDAVAGSCGGMEKWLSEILTQMTIRREHLPFKAVAELIAPPKKRVKKGEPPDTAACEDRLQTLTVGALKNYLFENKYKTYTKGFELIEDIKPAEMSDGELREIARFRYAPMFKGAEL